MHTIQITQNKAHEAVRLLVTHFLKKHKYIKTTDLPREAELEKDLKLSKTDIHLICNYVSITYNVGFHPIEAFKYKTYGELIDFLYRRIQRED